MQRTFIAIKIPLSNSIEKVFTDFTNSLQAEKIKWVDPHQLHVTLKFLGDTDESVIPDIGKKLEKVCSNTQSIILSLKGVGVFKNYRYPRVIWLGIERNEALQDLQQKIEEAMIDFNFEPENREFRPHLTLGRIKWIDNISLLKQSISKYEEEDFGICEINEVLYYKSDLTQQGPIYTTLKQAPFGG